MRTTIEVVDNEEAALLRAGLAEPDVRAFVKVVGVLRGLPSDRARTRVLGYVADAVDEAVSLEEM